MLSKSKTGVIRHGFFIYMTKIKTHPLKSQLDETRVETAPGEKDEKMNKISTYRVYIAGPDWDDNPEYVGTDYETAKKTFDELSITDLEETYWDRSGFMAILEKETRTYEFVNTSETQEDYPLEDYYEEPEYYKAAEEPEFEELKNRGLKRINAEADEVLHDVQRHFNCYGGYKTIDLDEEGTHQLKLRIKNHSGKWKNKGSEEYFLSIVISDKDPTEHFKTAGPEGISPDEEFLFDSNYTGEHIISFINEKIEEFKDYAAPEEEKRSAEQQSNFKTGIKNKLQKFIHLLKDTTLTSPPFDMAPYKLTADIITRSRQGELFNKVRLEKLANEFGITDQNTAKEMAELAIAIQARAIAHDNDLHSEFVFKKLVTLYEKQVNLSHRTSESIMLQQYSTPAPIGYLMGLYCKLSDGRTYFEPSAGNGLLTTAGFLDKGTVNEIDKRRSANLRYQGFAETMSQDASQPFVGMEKSFDAVLTNPPFGSVEVPVGYNGYDIKSLEQVMALRGLDTMKDDGRAAIIIGGHQEFDEDGRIKLGKNRVFFVYLYKHYNVEDVINIDGHALYSRQGTAFNTRMILINGRKQEPAGHPPLWDHQKNVMQPHNPAPVKDFETLYHRVTQLL